MIGKLLIVQYALDELANLGDLVNQALEVTESEDGQVTVDIYDIPDGVASATSRSSTT